MKQIKQVIAGVAAVVASLVVISSVSENNAGYRTVVQYPNGTLEVKFNPGWYFAPFAKETEYPDTMGYDFGGAEVGYSVRYQDGGRGPLDGNVRISLPADEPSMIKLHKAFLSPEGLMKKLLTKQAEEALSQTAGLLTSEEAYAEKRTSIAEYAEAIMERGRFVTKTVAREVRLTDGSVQTKQVPEIVTEAGAWKHQGSPFTEYGIQVTGLQVTGVDFEAATQTQIDEKRKAEMAAITARAKADKADWEKRQAAAEGARDVEKAKYEQMQANQKQIMDAERDKQVAITVATQQKEVNQLALEAAKIDVQTAKEQAAATTARAQAEAEAKRLLMEADGALDKKLAAYTEVMGKFAEAYQNRTVSDVPTIVMGGDGKTGTGGQSDFMKMLEAKVAKDLAVDVKATK